jgi:NADH-quinone oxidoreductase subunit J
MEALLFWVFAIVGVGCGFRVVSHRNPMSSAIYLIITMLCLAGLYTLLSGAFVAVVQVLIYAGAVMVLILFVIMMLSLREEVLRPEGSVPVWVLAGVVGLFLVWRLTRLFPRLEATADLAQDFGTIEAMGKTMFTEYLLPFELSAVLLLVAVIGAVILAKRPAP